MAFLLIIFSEVPYEKGLYGIDTARKNRKGMQEIPVDRKMKRGDFKYLYSKQGSLL